MARKHPRDRVSGTGHLYRPAKIFESKSRLFIECYIWDETAEKLSRQVKSVPACINKKLYELTARAMVDDIDQQLSEGRVINPINKQEPKAPKITFLEGITQANHNRANSGKRRTAEAARSLNNIFELWANFSPETKKTAALPVDLVEQRHVYEFLDWLKDHRKVGNTTRNNYLADLRTNFNFLIKRGLIKKNPTLGIERLKENIGKNIAFTPTQREKIESHLLQTDRQLYYFTRFIYFAFLRPAELLRLPIRAIDLDNRVIIVPAAISKNGQQQSVIITNKLASVIEEMKLGQYNPDHLLFSKGLKPGTEEIWRNRISERHSAVLKELELAGMDLTLYSWKHSGAVNAYRAGLDIKKLQKMLRHHSLEMTDIYLKSLGLEVDKDLQNFDW